MIQKAIFVRTKLKEAIEGKVVDRVKITVTKEGNLVITSSVGKARVYPGFTEGIVPDFFEIKIRLKGAVMVYTRRIKVRSYRSGCGYSYCRTGERIY